MFISQGPPGSLQAHAQAHRHVRTRTERKIYAVSLVTFIGWEVPCFFPPIHFQQRGRTWSCVCACARECVCMSVCVCLRSISTPWSRFRRRLALHLSLSPPRRLNFSANSSRSRLEGQTCPLPPVCLCRSLLLLLPGNFRPLPAPSFCQPSTALIFITTAFISI